MAGSRFLPLFSEMQGDMVNLLPSPCTQTPSLESRTYGFVPSFGSMDRAMKSIKTALMRENSRLFIPGLEHVTVVNSIENVWNLAEIFTIPSVGDALSVQTSFHASRLIGDRICSLWTLEIDLIICDMSRPNARCYWSMGHADTNHHEFNRCQTFASSEGKEPAIGGEDIWISRPRSVSSLQIGSLCWLTSETVVIHHTSPRYRIPKSLSLPCLQLLIVEEIRSLGFVLGFHGKLPAETFSWIQVQLKNFADVNRQFGAVQLTTLLQAGFGSSETRKCPQLYKIRFDLQIRQDIELDKFVWKWSIVKVNDVSQKSSDETISAGSVRYTESSLPSYIYADATENQCIGVAQTYRRSYHPEQNVMITCQSVWFRQSEMVKAVPIPVCHSRNRDLPTAPPSKKVTPSMKRRRQRQRAAKRDLLTAPPSEKPTSSMKGRRRGQGAATNARHASKASSKSSARR